MKLNLFALILVSAGITASAQSINTQNAQEYFRNLNYSTHNCEYFGRTNTCHRMLGTVGSRVKLENGLEVAGELFLLENGQYVFQYVELERRGPGTHGWVNQKEVTGEWKIEGVTLKLIGLGSATAADVANDSIDGNPPILKGLTLNYETDLISSSLKSKSSTFTPTISTSGMEFFRNSSRSKGK